MKKELRLQVENLGRQIAYVGNTDLMKKELRLRRLVKLRADLRWKYRPDEEGIKTLKRGLTSLRFLLERQT